MQKLHSTPINGLVGYWPEAFVALVEGTAPKEETQFKQVAVKLLDRRLNSHPIKAGLLPPPEGQGRLLNEFREVYLLSLTLGNPTERAAIVLNSVFMKALIDVSGGVDLDQDDLNYIRGVSLVSAFRAIKREQYFENPILHTYLEAYVIATTKHETIKDNVESYRGLTVEKIKHLNDRRIEISNAWYMAFKDGTLGKKDVLALYRALQDLETLTSNIVEESKQSLHPIILEAVKGYSTLRDEFPDNRRKDYINSVKSNLATFYKNVFKIDPKDEQI